MLNLALGKMVYDVGATTLDVATFNAHDKDGEDVFPIFCDRTRKTWNVNATQIIELLYR